ncbi:hypothetical protein TRIUR3_25669 [Triticum urartu]|uniref:Uncharacterized protein n=1 Tax=Triticum urartu TaxID=4572 RepID=M7Z9U7_TRIUA|nr:hypothetical protein TRIUR3_25669 [Triticum urartu]
MRPLRVAFGEMIKNAIHSRWEDDELLDFIDLLGYQTVGVGDVLGHPVLLSPHRRQLMYHKFHSEIPTDNQRNWLRANADPGANWKQVASNFDPTLKSIIAYQVRQVMRPSIMSSSDDDLVQHPSGFSQNVFGALHFSSVVTAHYHQHFKRFTQGNWREEIIGRVDLQLKTVLPRLLTKRYNAKFIR